MSKKRFTTHWNFDPNDFPGEDIKGESLTDVTFYEPLSTKLERFCYKGSLPYFVDDYADCDEDPTSSLSFDVMDYDMEEVEELIKASKLQPLKKDVAHLRDEREEAVDETKEDLNRSNVDSSVSASSSSAES